MKTLKITLLFIFILAATKAYSYDNLLFKPLTANVFEGRIGTVIQASEENLRLDIGYSMDMYDIKKENGDEIRFGADFFTYTRLRSEGRFKFPVETSDYYFGVNSSAKIKIADHDLFTRLRLAHISSHLNDGYSSDGVFWQAPFVYSREFFDLTFAIDFDGLRPYIGGCWIFSIQPDNSGTYYLETGVDYQKNIFGDVELVAGYDFKLNSANDVLTGVNTAQLGLLFRTSKNVGVLLSSYFYSGKSMHGMFFDKKDSYIGLGFQLIFY